MLRGGSSAAFLLRRMASARFLLASLLLAILLSAVLTAALASFGARALPAAVSKRLTAEQPVLDATAQIGAATAATATRVMGARLRWALPGVPLTMLRGLWSDPLVLPKPAGTVTVPLLQAVALGQARAHT